MPYDSDEQKFPTSERYDSDEVHSHYLKVFNVDEKSRTLTLLIRDDQWEVARGVDYLAYQSSVVCISRENALALADWINERFK